jgi:anaerobic ribonucleoside-triphosphate reductase activating protein
MQTLKVQINNLLKESYVDGPGRRSVAYLQGCPIHCVGCQSTHTWSVSGGVTRTIAEVAEELAGYAAEHGNVTISGGDPFFQSQALAELVYRLRLLGVKSILVYTGYTWEQLFDLCHPAYPYLKTILENVDILVDGPFIKAVDDDRITYRGSRNQRVIDVQESIIAQEPVELDWNNELIITDTGDILLPVGFASEFQEIGSVERSRRCGQSV